MSAAFRPCVAFRARAGYCPVAFRYDRYAIVKMTCDAVRKRYQTEWQSAAGEEPRT